MSGQSSYTQSVTERLVPRLLRPVASEDRARAALHVLDWVGCATAGAHSPQAVTLKKGLTPSSDKNALSNILYFAALGNVLEMDDVDKRALLHPGPVIIPAALLAAVEAKASMVQFLDAIVRGYEAAIRIGRAVGPDHYRYWHNTGTCGPFGAAAAVASIFDHDEEQLMWALGLAGTQASGFWQTRHEPASFAKQLHTSRAAHSGYLAATLAKSGFVGVRTILEGEQGFFAATCGNADPENVLAFSADDPWVIHEVSFKPWPACRHVHAAIDAALEVREQGMNWENAEEILIRTYEDALIFCDEPEPKDPLSAKFSLQHTVAVGLHKGQPALEDFKIDALSDREISSIRSKIHVHSDPKFTNVYPAHFGAAIELQYSNGISETVEINDALGDPENPASNDILITKAKTLMAAGGIPPNDRQKLRDVVLNPCGADRSVLELFNFMMHQVCHE